MSLYSTVRRCKHKLDHGFKIGAKNVIRPLRASSTIGGLLRLPRNEVVSVFDPPAQSQTQFESIEVHPSEERHRELPTFLNGSPHWRYKENQSSSCPASYAHRLENVYLWGHYGGNVFTKERNIIEELSPNVWGISLHDAFKKFRFPRPKHIKGKTLSLITKEAPSNYWHWMIDLLPKIKVVLDAGFDLNSFDNILIKWNQTRYQKETLETLGVDLSKLIEVAETDYIQLDELVCPTFKTGQYECPGWAIQWLRNSIKPSEPSNDPGQYIFLSRENCDFRRLTNESEIFDKLEPLGFKKLMPDRLSVAEQAHIYSKAKMIIGPHGAAFTNSIFCNPETVLYEMLSPDYVDMSFWVTTQDLDLQHYIHLSSSEESSKQSYKNARRQDFEISADQVASSAQSAIQDVVNQR
ncbi:MAG: glycosyltransferase family 61 protein [Symploca sp. SIO2D2]|nr:glycosyltransferase family 61 protein [Symploca sp. SIO2D2]